MMDGIIISAGGSTVQGLVVQNFTDGGIHLVSGGGNTIRKNYIGTDVSGTTPAPNSWGIYIDNSPTISQSRLT